MFEKLFEAATIVEREGVVTRTAVTNGRSMNSIHFKLEGDPDGTVYSAIYYPDELKYVDTAFLKPGDRISFRHAEGTTKAISVKLISAEAERKSPGR